MPRVAGTTADLHKKLGKVLILKHRCAMSLLNIRTLVVFIVCQFSGKDFYGQICSKKEQFRLNTHAKKFLKPKICSRSLFPRVVVSRGTSVYREPCTSLVHSKKYQLMKHP